MGVNYAQNYLESDLYIFSSCFCNMLLHQSKTVPSCLVSLTNHSALQRCNVDCDWSSTMITLRGWKLIEGYNQTECLTSRKH